MNKKIALSILPLLFLISCKTQEQIQRERMMDDMSVQMVQRQKLAAEDQIKLDSLEQKILELNGRLEEQGHKSQTESEDALNKIQERLELLEENMTAYKVQVEEGKLKVSNLETKVEAQEKYVNKVIKTLNSISGKKSKGAKKRSDYNQAIFWFNKNFLTKSKPLFLKLEKSKKIKGKKRARVLHALGIITFKKKQYNEAMVYLSQLFTEFPKSGYNANGLLHLAKTFKNLGETHQAKQTLGEMLKRFPKSKHVNTAKNLMGKL